MRAVRILLPLAAIGICSATLASEPFDGTWNLNVDKSRVMPTTMEWEDIGNGEVRFSNANQSYTYKIDGHQFKTPTGDQQSMEKVSNSLYRMTTDRGVVVLSETLQISPDGNTLYLDGKTTRRNGQSNESHNVFIRKSGSNGLMGIWEYVNTSKMHPQTLSIHPTGDNSFALEFSDSSTVDAQWDGKDYPFQGPTVPASSTMAFSAIGRNRFKAVHKVKAQTIEILDFKLSSDGKTMGIDSTNVHGQKLVVDVWEKSDGEPQIGRSR